MKYALAMLSAALLLASNAAIAKGCQYGSPASGIRNVKSVANMQSTKGDAYRNGPGWQYARNPTPSKFVSGYLGVSSRMAVEILCKKGKWVKVTPIRYEGEKIEQTPSWTGLDDQAGWIRTTVLEQQKTRLEKQGVWWTPTVPSATKGMSDKQIEIAIRGALQLIRNKPDCHKVSFVFLLPDNPPSKRYMTFCEDKSGGMSAIYFGKAALEGQADA